MSRTMVGVCRWVATVFHHYLLWLILLFAAYKKEATALNSGCLLRFLCECSINFLCQNCSKMRMRSSVLGWVLNSDWKRSRKLWASFFGWMMKSCATSSRSTCCRPGSLDILRRAEARARGLRVSSAPPASAMNSRLRDMAKRVSMVRK